MPSSNSRLHPPGGTCRCWNEAPEVSVHSPAHGPVHSPAHSPARPAQPSWLGSFCTAVQDTTAAGQHAAGAVALPGSQEALTGETPKAETRHEVLLVLAQWLTAAVQCEGGSSQ